MAAHPNLLYEGIGVSVPGRIDPLSHRLAFAPNLGWPDFELQTALQQATGLPVELENAANACALAELWHGRATEGLRNFIVVTVSEGIGTGMIMNGQLVRGASDLAGEFGHVQLLEDGPLCRCGNRGCWEVLGSNSAACRYYAEVTSPSGKRSKNITPILDFEDILRLADQNDAKAIQALELMANYLGAGISMLIKGMAPDAIVIVGEITSAWHRLGPLIEQTVKRNSLPHAATRIIPTDPAEQPRLRGAVVLVLQKHFGAPTVA
jgi:predicted NBD/HSP70 family sugar kinase